MTNPHVQLFVAEGSPDLTDQVSGRNLAVWVRAIIDDRGQAHVLIDCVELVAPVSRGAYYAEDIDHDAPVNDDPYRIDDTVTLVARLKLSSADAQKTARALTIGSWLIDQARA